MSLPQALISERPVVSYDIDGAREVVISDETGFLIPPRDIDQLAAALTRLAGDTAMRERFGREGRRRERSAAHTSGGGDVPQGGHRRLLFGAWRRYPTGYRYR